jgi:hypothetical protein
MATAADGDVSPVACHKTPDLFLSFATGVWERGQAPRTNRKHKKNKEKFLPYHAGSPGARREVNIYYKWDERHIARMRGWLGGFLGL